MIAPLALALALLAPSLTTLSGSGGGVVTVTADRVRYQLPKHRIEYTGNPVRMTRGDATLTCKQLTAQMNQADQVETATCDGDVRFVRADRTITCERAVYEEAAARLTCHGHPVLRSGALAVNGSVLVYDLAQDEVTLEDVQGTAPSEQVDARLKAYQERRKGQAAEGKP